MSILKNIKAKFPKPYFILVGLCISITLTTISCYDDEGNLIYPCEGANGENCEYLNSDEIQEILDMVIYTPLGLAERGVPLDSLYGKHYLDGIVFYVDVNDEIPSIDGVIASTTNLECEGGWDWECDVAVPGLNQVPCSNSHYGIDTMQGVRIGDGNFNSLIIANHCEGTPAKVCRDIGEGWFLPSKNELNSMYTNLHVKGHGGFLTEYNSVTSPCVWYCTSSENGQNVWVKQFKTNTEMCLDKHPFVFSIRAAKYF